MKKYAIFFPQFHQVDVNDTAWGYGFTDWALVATANAFDMWPRRAPATGFYDLANPEHIEAQFSKAAAAGVDGFGIYHYRFDDGPELDAVERYLKSASLPDNFNYFYIWANESWSKRWAGKDTEVLKFVSTNPSREKISEHVAYLAPYFFLPSYTRVGDRPLFVIYRPDFFEDTQFVLSCYREEFRKVGLDPLIGFCFKHASDIAYSGIFDFCYLFEPRLFFNFYGVRRFTIVSKIFKKLVHFLPYQKAEFLSNFIGKLVRRGSTSYSFSRFFEYFLSAERKQLLESLACPPQNILMSGWNNAPRYRNNFTAVETPNACQFSEMLTHALMDPNCSKEIPLLCNAWNEWSEGAAIEPCHFLGDGLLNAYVSTGKSKV